MNTKRAVLLSGLLIAVSLTVSAYAYPLLGDRMVTHWNAAGQPDDAMPTLAGLLIIPALAAGTVALLVWLPNIDPRGENFAGFREYYDGFVVVVTAYLAFVHVLVVGFNLGYEIDVTAAIMASVGLLLVYLGFLLDHVEPNWFVGIRTPWTLDDDRVWDATHRLGGRLFKLAGVVTLLGLVFEQYALVLLLGSVLLSAAITIGYSFFKYRQLGGGSTAGK